ncbi:MAG: hypothetical protein KBC57_02440 [Neisseriaceae bacterium]|nr:hypothetical protein [Neisseriaceae bacterium]
MARSSITQASLGSRWPKCLPHKHEPNRVVLHIGQHRSECRIGQNERISLALGTLSLPKQFFKHDRPNALEMEAAIAYVEDEVVKAWPAIQRLESPQLFSRDACLHEVAQLAQAPMQGSPMWVLPTSAVEDLFNRLTFIIEGRPASIEGLPTGKPFMAATLILREWLHHLRFHEITLIP